MNNNEKWMKLIKESTDYPKGLGDIEMNLSKRVAWQRRKKGAFASGLALVAASFLFVLFVNINVSFANTVMDLPLIGKLAEFVRFDKSLSLAIKNDYVQEVNLLAKDGDNSLYLPYLIADQRNLVLFFQVEEDLLENFDEWIDIWLNSIKDPKTGETILGYFYKSQPIYLNEIEENYGFVKCHYQFVDISLPKSMDMEFQLNIGDKQAGIFEFSLELEDFADPKVYEIDEIFNLLGQEIVLDNMYVYPSGIEVNFSFPEENSALIKGFEMSLLEDGEEKDVYEFNKRGTAFTDSKMTVYIESNYFSKPKEQILQISGLSLLNKDEEYISVNLDKKTMNPLVEGLDLISVVKDEDKAILTFSSLLVDKGMGSSFDFRYSDSIGNHYSLDNIEMHTKEDLVITNISTVYPESGIIILKRDLPSTTYLVEPLRIKLVEGN